MRLITAPGHLVVEQRLEEDVVPGKRLGRHIRFDTRSLAYPVRRVRSEAITATLWTRHIPILDQGNLGSCEGNSEVGCVGTTPLFEGLAPGHVPLDETEAVALYSAATRLDPFSGTYPPSDTGTDSTSVNKAAKKAGLISGYLSALTLADVLSALMAGPVNLGINWYSSFDDPAADGEVSIAPGAWVRGGHAPMARGVDPAGQTVFLDNSWGTSWGAKGSFVMGWGTLERLLAEGGEAVAPQPAALPPPVPVDADHALWDVLGPWCSFERTRPDLVKLQAAGLDWAAEHGLTVPVSRPEGG